MDNKKMRAEFEAWRLEKFCGGEDRLRKCSNAPDVYYYTAEQEAWKAWQASRSSLVVVLPNQKGLDKPFTGTPMSEMMGDNQYNLALARCRAAIEAAGIKVKS